MPGFADYYILLVLDVFSRFLYARPLKDKSALTVSAALRDILAENARRRFPKVTYAAYDAGKEFSAEETQALLKSQGIKGYQMRTEMGAPNVERVIQ